MNFKKVEIHEPSQLGHMQNFIQKHAKHNRYFGLQTFKQTLFYNIEIPVEVVSNDKYIAVYYI